MGTNSDRIGNSFRRALFGVLFLLVTVAAGGEESTRIAGTRCSSSAMRLRLYGAMRSSGWATIGATADVPPLHRSRCAIRMPTMPTPRARGGTRYGAIWARSGNAEVDTLYRTGIEQMAAGDLQQSIATFTRVIEKKPDFAEGWNKRATLYFLAGDLKKSLADCDEVMKRNPNHFGALSGYAQIYVRLERYERANDYSRRALALNPNLSGIRELIEALERLDAERRRRTT